MSLMYREDLLTTIRTYAGYSMVAFRLNTDASTAAQALYKKSAE